MCAIHGGLPYDRMTSRMVIELMKYIVIMLNAFPPKSGILWTYIPHTFVTGKKLDFKKQFQCPFGAYVQKQDDCNITNKMIDRNQGTICLGPMGNIHGTYAFLLIRTRRKITQSQFTELQTPPSFTQRVMDMAIYEKQ